MPGKNHRKRRSQALTARIGRRTEVARLHFGEYKPAWEIARALDVSTRTVERDIRTIRKETIIEAGSEWYEALGRHLAVLYQRGEEAWRNSQAAQQDGHRIQWFKRHLDAMRQVADLLGFQKQAQALRFVQGDERFILATGGLDALEVFAQGRKGQKV